MSKLGIFRKIIHRLFKSLYWPICRAYARHFVKDRPADAIYMFMCRLPFYRVHHFWPSFTNPRRFSEKTWSYMLFNRNPQLTMLADKLCVRDHVAARIGSDYLIPLLWSGEDPEEIPYKTLPNKFVIKANHGCGYNIFIRNKAQINQKEVQIILTKWLRVNFCEDRHIGSEWAYRNIKPAIIIEEFVEENGRLPKDYKFWCFSGRVECIIIYFDRFKDLSAKTFDREMKPIDLSFNVPKYRGDYHRPKNFDHMVQLAESLSRGFEFVRIDLYNLDGRILFGECTFYHGGTLYKFNPPAQDLYFGEKWKSNLSMNSSLEQ